MTGKQHVFCYSTQVNPASGEVLWPSAESLLGSRENNKNDKGLDVNLRIRGEGWLEGRVIR